MARQIEGAQRDFSYGEVDVDLKRADDHPARKGGLRQMANARIHNSGSLQNRSGRRALYPITDNGLRTERFTISAGKVFDIQFAAGRLKIIDATGTTVANFIAQGNGAALPWTALNLNTVDYAILNLSVYVTFAGMRPQTLSFDGVSTWSIADYTELLIGSQKRTLFYRISPQGITIQPANVVGVNILITASAPLFTVAWVGTRIRYSGRQILITSFTDSTHVNGTVIEALPGVQTLDFTPAVASNVFSVGDVVRGGNSGSQGIVLAVGVNIITVQLLTISTSSSIFAFINGEVVSGPGGGMVVATASALGANPGSIAVWDEEVMNDFRGYPASCFTDQFRLGFTNFPAIPGAIAWSSINTPTDLYVTALPTGAMLEIAPRKVQVYYVVPGPEGSEFVFCDRGVFYIPISETNPLKPGSVAFKLLSDDGAAPIKPRRSQEAILYVNAGQNSMMAVIATGAFLRPFNTKNLSDYHAHLFNGIQAIAAPSADGTFNERYAYVLNGDGSIAVGKYKSDTLPGNEPVIGWGPWSGAGAVTWISASASAVLFTSNYFGAGVVEVLDDAQYLDCALPVNAGPAAFTPPVGKGPLWFIPSQSVTLIDQGTRMMGTYQIDANGFIVPQGQGGENLAAVSLVAGQPWTMIAEPFCPDAQPGSDVGQRMNLRYIARLTAYVINSTGFVLAKLFSARQTATSPALGTVMNTRRIPAWNVDDDATKPPKLRETAESWRPSGGSYDPRVAIIKDTPGPLVIAEIGIEVSV